MGSYQCTTKQNTAQSSQQHAPPIVVPQPPQVQQQTIQAKSNEEGLAEHAERLRKFQRLGNSMMQMGPPRPANDKTSSLQPKPWIQRKLTIGEPGDKYEQEADRVASQVAQHINAPTFKENSIRESIQREKDLEGVMCARGFQAAIQRKQAIESGEASADLESAISSARSSGQPLDARLQQSMGQAMGADFSGVRVHTDAQSDQLNQSIQAKAFTTGQDVFFREGAYQPGNREGQELIAHELTHVIQQKGGAVQRDINSEEGDEDTSNLISSKSFTPTLQAKVGFEFETGWYVERLTKDGDTKWLSKKDRIGTPDRDGYKLEADEAEDDKSEVEFIVHPPVEENEVGVLRLENIMNRMLILGGAMKSQFPGKFNLGILTGNFEDSKFIITPKDKELKAGPQVTTGLKLASIESLNRVDESLQNPNFRKLVYGDEDVSEAPKELKRSLSTLQSHAAEVRKAIGIEVSPALIGLLTIIRSYLLAGSYKKALMNNDPSKMRKEVLTGVALSYPKQIADLLLARTHFGKLFSLIPKKEREFYSKNAGEWVKLALTASGGLKPDGNVIERGIQNDENDINAGFSEVKLTRKDWLTEMVKGEDLLKKIKDSESMGEMDKTEEVGANDGLFDTREQAGIFEFRGAQTTKIPLDRWKPFALEFLKFIIAVHG